MASAFSGLVWEQTTWRPGTNPQQQQERQPIVPPQQQKLLQQEFLQQQQRLNLTPARERYKSCDFCAKRKRKCSGGLPRCSFCIEKKQPYCHYQLKQVAKARASKQAAARQGPSSSSPPSDPYGSFGARKRVVGVPEVAVHSDLGMMTVVGVRSIATGPGSMPLKRCRLSPSPATGLVGLRENGFLGDFFGCLGFLPLATERHVREAMVEILLGASAPGQPQLEAQFGHQGRVSNGDSMMGAQQAGGGQGRFADGSEEVGWGGTLAYPGVTGSPATCMMWCAVALGALVMGAPIDYVSEYVRLARESVAECFDGSSVEDARAFLMMSFLHGYMNDMDKNDNYLSFAKNIVSQLREEDVPKELGAMLLTVEKMGSFRNPFVRSVGDDIFVDTGRTVDLPRVDTIVEQKDLCNLFLVSDRRVKQVFFEDMRAQGAFTAESMIKRNRDPSPREQVVREEQVGVGTAEGVAHQRRGEGPRDGRPRPLGMCDDLRVPDSWDTEPCWPPPAAAATNRFIEEALPEMERLSKMLQRGDTFSGVGGLLYHGTVAYMKSATGEMGNAFKSLEACVDVIVRYPGLVRFRTHLVHCTLGASHLNGRRDVYEALRRVYNSVRPPVWKYAGPFEEWTSISDICDHIFCRSAEVQMGIRHRRWLAKCRGGVPTPSPSSSPNSTLSSSSEHHPLEVLGQGAQQPTAVPSAPIRERRDTPPPASMPQDDRSCAAAGGGGESVRRDLPGSEPLQTDACTTPQFVSTAATAVAVGDPRVGWSTSPAAGQMAFPGGTAAVPAAESALEPRMVQGMTRGKMLPLTEEDMLDAAAVFLGGEGLLENAIPS